MTAAPKSGSLWKLPCRGILVRRARFPWCEAGALGEGMGKCTQGGRRGMGPSAYTRVAEIMSGRAITQQGLAATCKDSRSRGAPRGREREMVWRMSPYERRRRGNALRGGSQAALEWVTPRPGKGALGTWRPWRAAACLDAVPGDRADGHQGEGQGKPMGWGAYAGQRLSFPPSGKALVQKIVQGQGQNRTREIRPSGIAGRLWEP
jgi:hypothetical protein